jgi:peptidoglycan/LPS O-acetylase OafA/YrhL
MQSNDSQLKHIYFPEIQYLRALAVTMVATYHFIARRAELLPYGNWATEPPFSFGWVGVYLFFVVSGFVISVSIKASPTAKNFLWKRIARIYPGLFVILPIVFVVQRYTPHSIFSERSNLPNLLTSLVLLPPKILNQAFSLDLDWLTLVLWSLKVELFFYLLVFVLRTRLTIEKTITVIPCMGVALGIAGGLSEFIQDHFSGKLNIIQPLQWFGLDFLNWFAIGLLMAKSAQNKLGRVDWLLLAFNYFFAILFLGNYHVLHFALIFSIAVLLGLIPILGLMRDRGVKFENTILIGIGNSSYEMYLLHQGVGFTILYFFCYEFKLGVPETLLLTMLIFILCLALSHFLWSRVTAKFSTYLRIRG